MNKHRMFAKKTVAFIFFLSLSFIINGQTITKIIRVISGGNVSFNFNSITEYANGKSLNGYTKLYISFTDTIHSPPGVPVDGTSTGWEVLLKANSATIQSDGTSPDLALSFIEVRPTTTIPGATVNNIILTNANQTIVAGPDPGVLTTTGEIIINLDCGTTTPLLGKIADYYFLDLIFTIKEIP